MAQQYNSNYTGREIDEAIGVVRTEGGIPKGKLASDVQTSLGKADTALQPAALEPYRTSAAQDVIDGEQNTAIAAKYTMPTDGIPETDLDADVRNKLNVTNIGTFTIEGGNAPKSFIKAIIVGRTLSVGAEFIGNSASPTCHHTAVILVCEGNVIRFLYSNDDDKKIQSCAYVPDSDESFNSYSPVSAAAISGWNAKYDKPASGIPAQDLDVQVRIPLGKADTALQPTSIKTLGSGGTTGQSLIGTGELKFKTVNEQSLIGEEDIHIPTVTVEDVLTSTSATNALSANQGRVLKGLVDEKYVKPATGIPLTDLASAVQTSLGKADTALQTHQSIKTLGSGGTTGQSLIGTDELKFKTVAGNSLIGDGDITIPGVTVEDVLTSTSATNALSANQGRVLKGMVDTKATDTDVVHKSGNETINGAKIFSGGVEFSNHPTKFDVNKGAYFTAQDGSILQEKLNAGEDYLRLHHVILSQGTLRVPRAVLGDVATPLIDTDAANKSYVDSHHDSAKQDTISDLTTIRSGASAGATALQPAALTPYRTSAAQDAIDNAQNTAIEAKYTMPEGGIPESNLATSVQNKLNVINIGTFAIEGDAPKSFIKAIIEGAYTLSVGAKFVGNSQNPNYTHTAVILVNNADIVRFLYAGEEQREVLSCLYYNDGSDDFFSYCPVSSTDITDWNSKYLKPSGGIPKTDLASAVQTSLGKADSALQEHQSIKTLASGTATGQSLIGSGDFTFKTVNGQSLIGTGDISGGSSVTVVDNLESTSTTSALSANQGRVLKGMVDGKYAKPEGGIPSTDMTTAVQTSLGKADSALQSGSLKTINQTSLVGSGDISIPVVQVIDSTSSSSTTAALSANQGRQLNAALSNKQATISDLTTIRSGAAAGATAYQKPASGIPSTDLESAVQTKLTNAVLTTGAQTISGAKTFSAVPSCTVAPTTANHITNKTYVDGVVATKATDTAVVHKAEAETVTGLKSFEGGFTAYDATFIDEAIFTDSTSGGHSVEVKHVYDEQGGVNVLEFDGDVSTSVRLKKILAPIDGTDAANKSYVDGHHDSTKADESAAVHKTGDETISGKMTFSAYGNEFAGIIAHEFTLSDTNEESDVYFHTYCDDDHDQVLWFDGNQGSVYLGGFSAPKVSNQLANKGYVDSVAATKAPAITLGSSYPAGGFVPNVYYNMGTISSDVTWNLATATNIFDEYMIEFSVGSTVPAITWGTGFTKWIGGSAPTLLANKTYQISVQNGLAVAGEF